MQLCYCLSWNHSIDLCCCFWCWLCLVVHIGLNYSMSCILTLIHTLFVDIVVYLFKKVLYYSIILEFRLAHVIIRFRVHSIEELQLAGGELLIPKTRVNILYWKKNNDTWNLAV